MNTDDLVRMLARDPEPVDSRASARRYAIAVSAGLAGAAAVLLSLYGVRPQLAADAQQTMFWGKFGYVALLLAGGVFAAARLSRPGAALSWAPAAIAAPLLAMWIAAAVMLLQAGPGEREQLIFGASWNSCPFNIALLSLPGFAAAFWAMKGLAPTRLRLAGAAAGLCAGAIGALVYTFSCYELAPPFLGIWYVLGMLIPTALGALFGPRLLGW
ncbi:MAG: DUF1109 domain-containing protein [Betaproteobacteria bacterium]|nr:DUF1109 domain-containing protein [Betaproteobacteria bacterium]